MLAAASVPKRACRPANAWTISRQPQPPVLRHDHRHRSVVAIR